jgi:hypothetical protein
MDRFVSYLVLQQQIITSRIKIYNITTTYLQQILKSNVTNMFTIILSNNFNKNIAIQTSTIFPRESLSNILPG